MEGGVPLPSTTSAAPVKETNPTTLEPLVNFVTPPLWARTPELNNEIERFLRDTATKQHHEVHYHSISYSRRMLGMAYDGIGTHALVNLGKGTFPGFMPGRIVSRRPSPVPPDMEPWYLMGTKNDVRSYLLVTPKDSLMFATMRDARFIPYAAGKEKKQNNARCLPVIFGGVPRILVQMTKSVKAGDEIFISYGCDYKPGTNISRKPWTIQSTGASRRPKPMAPITTAEAPPPSLAITAVVEPSEAAAAGDDDADSDEDEPTEVDASKSTTAAATMGRINAERRLLMEAAYVTQTDDPTTYNKPRRQQQQQEQKKMVPLSLPPAAKVSKKRKVREEEESEEDSSSSSSSSSSVEDEPTVERRHKKAAAVVTMVTPRGGSLSWSDIDLPPPPEPSVTRPTKRRRVHTAIGQAMVDFGVNEDFVFKMTDYGLRDPKNMRYVSRFAEYHTLNPFDRMAMDDFLAQPPPQ